MGVFLLRKCCGDLVAVDVLSIEIEDGHVYGYLFPVFTGKRDFRIIKVTSREVVTQIKRRTTE
jgi:hypothetical protein